MQSIRPSFSQLLAIPLFGNIAPSPASFALSLNQQKLPYPAAEDRPNTISLLLLLVAQVRSIESHSHSESSCTPKRLPTDASHILQTASCSPIAHRLSLSTTHNTVRVEQTVGFPVSVGCSACLQSATLAYQLCGLDTSSSSLAFSISYRRIVSGKESTYSLVRSCAPS